MSRDRLASLTERFGGIESPEFLETVIKQLVVRADACARHFEAEGIPARPGWGLEAPLESQAVSRGAEPEIAPQPAGAEEVDETGEADEAGEEHIPRKRGKRRGPYWDYLVKLIRHWDAKTPFILLNQDRTPKSDRRLSKDVRTAWENRTLPLPQRPLPLPRLPQDSELRRAIAEARQLAENLKAEMN
jgi:hypothetical protein